MAASTFYARTAFYDGTLFWLQWWPKIWQTDDQTCGPIQFQTRTSLLQVSSALCMHMHRVNSRQLPTPTILESVIEIVIEFVLWIAIEVVIRTCCSDPLNTRTPGRSSSTWVCAFICTGSTLVYTYIYIYVFVVLIIVIYFVLPVLACLFNS